MSVDASAIVSVLGREPGGEESFTKPEIGDLAVEASAAFGKVVRHAADLA